LAGSRLYAAEEQRSQRNDRRMNLSNASPAKHRARPSVKGGEPAPRLRNRPAREQALLRAAAGLFASCGYDGTTTRDIAAEAACAEGLIHRYFGGKEGLLRKLIRSQIAQQQAELRSGLPLADDLEEECTQLVSWGIERSWLDRDLLRVLVPLALSDSAIGGEIKSTGVAQYVDILVDRLRRAGDESHSSEQLDDLARTIAGLSLSFGFMLPSLFGQNRHRAKKTALAMAKNAVRDLKGSNHRESAHPAFKPTKVPLAAEP
jgi:AcrR family transcriptional regulator